MAEIINLRRVRKLKQKSAKEAEAAQNRITHGRTRSEKEAAKAEDERQRRLHEGKRLSDDSKEEGPA